MIEPSIYNYFCQMLTTLASGLDSDPPIAFPNVHFVPPDSGCWLEVKHFPNEVENYGIADDGGEWHYGYFQVGVCYRQAIGLVTPMQIAGDIVSGFTKGTIINPARVTRQPSAMPALQLDEHSVIPVMIPYRVFD